MVSVTERERINPIIHSYTDYLQTRREVRSVTVAPYLPSSFRGYGGHNSLLRLAGLTVVTEREGGHNSP
jgi:hypothetical protein